MRRIERQASGLGGGSRARLVRIGKRVREQWALHELAVVRGVGRRRGSNAPSLAPVLALVLASSATACGLIPPEWSPIAKEDGPSPTASTQTQSSATGGKDHEPHETPATADGDRGGAGHSGDGDTSASSKAAGSPRADDAAGPPAEVTDPAAPVPTPVPDTDERGGWLGSLPMEERMSIESFDASWVSPSTSPALEVRLSLVGTAWSSPSIDVIVRGQCVVEGENLVDWAVFRVKPEKLLKSGGKVAVSTMFEPARLKAPPARCSLEVATHQASSDLTDFSKDKVAEVRRLGGWCLGAGALAKGACPAAPVEAPTDPKGLVRAFVIDWGTDARGRPSRRIDVRAHLTTNRALAHGALQFVRAKCTAGDVALPSLERNVILGPMLAGESHVASIGLAVVRPDAPEPTRCDVTLHGTMFESREVDSCFEHGVISSGACASADSKTAGDPRCAPLDAVGEDVAFACRRVLAAWYEPAALDVWVACMVKGGGKSPCAPVVADRSAELQEKRPSDEAERAVEAATKSCKNVEDTLSRSSATARDAAWRGKAKCIELLSQMTSQGRDDVLACLDDNCREGECFLSLDACADGEGLGDGP